MTTKLIPYPFQEVGIAHIDKCNGRAMIFDEMGLGKTIQALFWTARNPADAFPAVVVCPANAKYVWEHHSTTHCNLRAFVCQGRKPPERSEFSQTPKLHIINYDILHYWLPYFRQLGIQTIVYDECQLMGNRGTLRTEAGESVSLGVPNIILLSGTPLTNYPINLYPALHIARPDVFSSYWEFAVNFCEPKKFRGQWSCQGATNIGTLRQLLLDNGMIRRRKVDVLKDLPKKIRHVVPMKIAKMDEYQYAMKDFKGWLREYHGAGAAARAGKALQMVRVGYLLRLVGKLKLRAVVDWANEFLAESDEKLILYAYHKKFIEVLERRINYPKVTLDGDTNQHMRKVVVDQFQNDKKTRLFIGNMTAASTAITLTAASTTGVCELYWVPTLFSQLEDRAHRIGQTETTWINYLVCPGTIEERLCELVQKKQEIISAILDGGTVEGDFDVFDKLVEYLEAA